MCSVFNQLFGLSFMRVAAVALALVCSVGQAAMSEEEESTAKLVIAGCRDGRTRLRSGVFHATGRRRYKSEKYKIDSEENVRIFSAFDYGRSLLRFDREEAPYNPSNDPNGFGGQFIRTPSQILQVPPKGKTVTVLSPETRPMSGVNPFDIRMLGCANLKEMESGASFDQLFDPPKGFMTFDRLQGVSRAGNIIQLTWDFPQSRIRRRIWFDPKFGYSPIRLEERLQLEGSGDYSEPLNVCEVSWLLKSEIWVPSTVSISNYLGVAQNPGNAPQIRGYDLEIVWDLVNEAVNDRLFTPEGFREQVEEKPATRVVDVRLGSPVVIQGGDPPKPVPLVASRSSHTKTILFVLNGCAIVVVIIVVWKYGRRSAS